jgi:hypothetical protein
MTARIPSPGSNGPCICARSREDLDHNRPPFCGSGVECGKTSCARWRAASTSQGDRLQVTEFPDQDDVGVLPQGARIAALNDRVWRPTLPWLMMQHLLSCRIRRRSSIVMMWSCGTGSASSMMHARVVDFCRFPSARRLVERQPPGRVAASR